MIGLSEARRAMINLPTKSFQVRRWLLLLFVSPTAHVHAVKDLSGENWEKGGFLSSLQGYNTLYVVVVVCRKREAQR
jgi:hypothetical protein